MSQFLHKVFAFCYALKLSQMQLISRDTGYPEGTEAATVVTTYHLLSQSTIICYPLLSSLLNKPVSSEKK